MSIIFDYQDVSVTAQSITRSLTVSVDDAAFNEPVSAFQFSVAYDPNVVTIDSRALVPLGSETLSAMNPANDADLANTNLFRASGVAMSGLSADQPLLVMQYTHAIAADPIFAFSNVLLNENFVVEEPVITSHSDPVPVIFPVIESGSGHVVLGVVGSSGDQNLYTFSDGRVGVSAEAATTGQSINAGSIVFLKMTALNYVDANVIETAGVSDIQFNVVGQNAIIDLSFEVGSQTALIYDLSTGMLTSSYDIPAGQQPVESPNEDSTGNGSDVLVDVTVSDGINVDSGTTDAVGLEVDPSEVSSYFVVPNESTVLYRQRLDDAVAYESLNRDNSMVAKIVASPSSDTVATVNTGSLNLSFDAPAGVNLDIIGLSGDVSSSRATNYLNTLVDAATGSDATLAPWANSLKTAIAKMGQAHVGENVDVKVFTPSRTNSGTDEISLSSLGSSPNIGAVLLSSVSDLISVSEFESIVAVGPGRLNISGTSGANVFGDSMAQEIVGGIGDDMISGGGGDDTLFGGAGSDTFDVGYSGTAVLGDLNAEDSLNFSLFGVGSLEQLAARLVSVTPGQQGLRVQFDDFALELVGYNDLSQFSSDITFG